MSEIREPVPVRSWYLFYGGIRGIWPDGSPKRSSRLVSRSGNCVTTQSGSLYLLTEPEPADSDLQQIDKMIQGNARGQECSD